MLRQTVTRTKAIRCRGYALSGIALIVAAIASSGLFGFGLLWKTHENLWKIHLICGKKRLLPLIPMPWVQWCERQKNQKLDSTSNSVTGNS